MLVEKNDGLTSFAALLVAILCVLPLLGCGRKAAPRVPQSQPVSAVSTLQASVHQGAVHLTWRSPEDAGTVGAYAVYRTATDLDEADCSDCRRRFYKQGQVDRAGPNGVYIYIDAAQPGYRYTYKLKPLLRGGETGPSSNSASVVLPEPD